MAKRGSKKSTAPTHLVEPLKSKVIDIMDCLGGDDYAYYELDNIKQSLLAFKNSVQLNPYDQDIYYRLGLIYEKLLQLFICLD